MHAELEWATITELSLPSGDWIQVFGPDDPIFAFLGDHARGPIDCSRSRKSSPH
jgi:hypothetical protein